ncbi:MAG TPA: class C sortase [Ruminococcaceae bacterium]|nr:class C sortase [Oscillospiraceae bacterium]
MKKQRSKKSTNMILIVVFAIGLSLMLYPTLSNLWNKNYTSRIISEYNQILSDKDEQEYQNLFDEAVAYNQSLEKGTFAHILSKKETEKYESMLNVTNSGMMGYVEIPSIDVKLPIYHGVDEGVLQVAAGHLNWSSLPVGGTTSHCIISGHRGLPSAKLFSDLDELVEGDFFEIKVLNQSLWYEVDKISIIEPNKLDDLTLVKGQDYVTLVTCTPYGINTHRLLVRGHRVTDAMLQKVLQVTADAAIVSPVLISIILFVPLSLCALSIPLIINKKRKTNTNGTSVRK